MAVDGHDLVEYIALRKKSGIDTLDASSEDRLAAGNIDVESFEAHRIRGFLRDGVSFGGLRPTQRNSKPMRVTFHVPFLFLI